MEVLRIEWHRTFDNAGEGYMEIYVDKFFPCTVEKAKKLFKLVNRWCSDETIAELLDFFTKKINDTKDQIDEIKKVYPSTTIGSKEKKQCEDDFKHLQAVLKKYQRNMEFLQERK